jgi:hypothetical protein
MGQTDDKLKGLSYQGLTHLQTYSGPSLDQYRQAIRDNTQRLYQQLPEESIYYEGSYNPMQVSKIDSETVFLDIKFPNYPIFANACREFLTIFAQLNNLPLASRGGFGFVNSNFTLIDSTTIRFTPGLESRELLDRYSEFFNDLQSIINMALDLQKLKKQEWLQEIKNAENQIAENEDQLSHPQSIKDIQKINLQLVESRQSLKSIQNHPPSFDMLLSRLVSDEIFDRMFGKA